MELLEFAGWDDVDMPWLTKIMNKPVNIQTTGECSTYGDWTFSMKKQLLKDVSSCNNFYGFDL